MSGGGGIGDLAGWSWALAPRLTSLARGYLPGAPIGPRHREHVAIALADALGHGPLRQAHEVWYSLLGPAELTEADDDVVAWATAAALGGPAGLDAPLPADVDVDVARELQALVAYTAAASVGLAALEALRERVRRRDGGDPVAVATQVVSMLVGGLLAAPTVASGAIFGLLGRVVPEQLIVEADEDPNLLVQLLAETLPTWLGSAWGRTVVASVPVSIPVAVRAGLTGATVWVGRGRVAIANGLDPEAWAVFDGEVDALVQAGSHTLTREVRADRLRR